MATAHKHRITSPPGSDMRRALKIVNELSTATAEIIADHAVGVTWDTEVDAAVTELIADHATTRTNNLETETLIEELHDDHATNKALIDELLFKVAFLVHRDQNRNTTGTSPVFAIDTDFDVKNTETCAFVAAGVPYTLTDNTSCDTGTSKTITASQWAAFVIDATNATTLTATWTAGSSASEAAALALARAIPFVAGKARLGIVTVQAHASGFTAGTDALTTGTGGNVATATNYYQFFDLVPITTTSSAATLTAPKPASPPAALTATAPTTHAAALTATVTGDTIVTASGGTVGM